MLTVTAAASSRQLTTTTTLKTELNISGSTYDAQLSSIIDQASAAIASYCNREFAKETVSETLQGVGGHNLMVTRTPIVSVTSITFDAATVPTTDYTVNEPNAGIIYSKCGGWNDTARRCVGASRIPDAQSREYLYTVVYVAGYVLPSFGSGTRDLPYDIERACVEFCKAFWLRRQRDPSIASESVPGVYDVTYKDEKELGNMVMPSNVMALLVPWKRYA